MSTAAVDLRYPVGKFEWTPAASEEEAAKRREHAVDVIAALPEKLRAAVAGLSDAQLDTPYRPDGWTVRQVVHHVADSHMNAYIRWKLALTEQDPTIKAYDQDAWAKLPDTQLTPIAVSLSMIEALHTRWAILLRAIPGQDCKRGFVHPEMQRRVPLEMAVEMYAWHCKHHVEHIVSLRKRNGW